MKFAEVNLITTRIGFGYDAHRFAEGRRLVLGGVHIPYPRGLDGHSDADVLLHAVCDSLLGAACLGDLGRHFPDSDPAFRGISSLTLLSTVGEMVRKEGYSVVNVDASVVMEEPKVSPHVVAMRENIARALNIASAVVSVKATTNERMGAIGAKEGAVAFAVALVARL